MSGGGGQSTQSSGPPAWMQPHLESFINRSTAVADQPYTPYTGQRTADLNPFQTSAMSGIYGRAMGGAQDVNAARGEATKSLQGGYLSPESNPYLSGMVNKAMGDVTKNYSTAVAPMTDASFARKGAFGGSAWADQVAGNQKQMTDQLGGIANDMYGGNYENERRRMTQYASMVPTLANQDYIDANALMGVGDKLQNYNQGLLDTQYGQFKEAQNYPVQQLDIIRQALGLPVGTTSTSTQPSGSKLSGAAGGAMVGSQLAGPWGAIGGGLLGLLG